MKEKYKIDTTENKLYVEAMADNLFRFGKRFPSPGGSSWYLGDDGRPWTEKNRETWITCRMHWTLAEAINTSAVLYRVTGKSLYADFYAQFMKYLDETVADHVNGSWFHQLDRENHLIGTVWPGKSDLYHALQSMLIQYLRVDKSIAAAVKEK